MIKNNEVGYGKPPREHQFKPARSGNPLGRPARSRLDIAARLQEPITFIINGEQRTASPFEAGHLSKIAKAVKGNMRAARSFMRSCERAGMFVRAVVHDDHQYWLTIPNDWDGDEWMAMYERHGPPPWKGDRDGLVQSPKNKL